MQVLLLLIALFTSSEKDKTQIVNPNAFITTWNTSLPGQCCLSCIQIPTHPDETYLYDVDWNNDGVWDTLGITGSFNYNFGTPGVYQVAIEGIFPRISFAHGYDNDRIISIDQWGNNVWTSMEQAFEDCDNLNGQAIDSPNLSSATSLSKMFERATNFNQDISSWDVSNITDFSRMFYAATSFNQDLNQWNVSSAISMDNMFSQASSFNQDISRWDVSNVVLMYSVFNNASSFNQDLSSWTLSSVVGCDNMFDNTAMDINNYDSFLISLLKSPVPTNVLLGASGLHYCNGAEARDSLINNFGWIFSGDSQQSAVFNSTQVSNANWYGPKTIWLQDRYPTKCDAVVISNDRNVGVLSGDKAYGKTLRVDLGSILEIQLGAELEIGEN